MTEFSDEQSLLLHLFLEFLGPSSVRPSFVQGELENIVRRVLQIPDRIHLSSQGAMLIFC